MLVSKTTITRSAAIAIRRIRASRATSLSLASAVEKSAGCLEQEAQVVTVDEQRQRFGLFEQPVHGVGLVGRMAVRQSDHHDGRLGFVLPGGGGGS